MKERAALEPLSIGALGLVLAIIDVSLWGSLASARARANDALADSATVNTLSQQIQELRQRPAIVGAREIASSELAKRIEQSATASQLPLAALARISPDPARRIGDSAYVEKQTQVVLRQITLEQLFLFLRRLTDNSAGLTARSIRLSAPREDPSGRAWTVELTLSSLVFSPPAVPAGGRSGT